MSDQLEVWIDGKKVASGPSLGNLIETGEIRGYQIRSDAIVVDPRMNGSTVLPMSAYLVKHYQPLATIGGIKQQIQILNDSIEALEEVFAASR